jgi:capsular polysaccharide biosynthesis protein
MAKRTIIINKMESRIIFDTKQEKRRKPINLINKDVSLFSHEFTVIIPPVKGFQLSDVSILRNVIFSMLQFKFFKSLTHLYKTPNKYFLKRLRLFLTPPFKLEYGIWITDEISAEYFHWFTDALTRLKAIESAQGDISFLKSHFPVVLPESYREKPYISTSLEMMGYTPYFYNPKRRLSVASLLSCTHTAPTGNYNSELILKLHLSLAKNSSPKPERKIYISRAKATRRTVRNERELINLLIRYDYEIHNFEDYTFPEQLNLMSTTKSLIALHGAGLTNMMFMNKGSQILELRNDRDSHNNCYFALASSLSHDYYYLTNTGDTEDTYNVNVNVDPDRLQAVLELMKN